MGLTGAADEAREMFPPLEDAAPVITAEGAPTDVLIDAAAAIRSDVYAAHDVSTAIAITKTFGSRMCGRYPRATDFHLLLEGDVTPAKAYEQALRRKPMAPSGIHLGLPLRDNVLPAPLAAVAARMGETTVGDVLVAFRAAHASPDALPQAWLDLYRSYDDPRAMDAATARRIRARRATYAADLPPPLAAVAAALAAERGTPTEELILKDVVRRYVARGVEQIDEDAFADPAWKTVLAHACMPELEQIARDSLLKLAGVRAHVATILVDGREVLPPEGERRALPYARHLGRACVLHGNDTDIFAIALLQVPRFAAHPPVYYFDIARSRKGVKHVIDLVACVRAVERAGGPTPADRALTLLLCGNDYVPAPAEGGVTVLRLAGTNPATAKRARDETTLPRAYERVAAQGGDVERMTDMLVAGMPGRATVGVPRRAFEMLVRRALVARQYYASGRADTDPAEAEWLANGWRTPTEPWLLKDMLD